MCKLSYKRKTYIKDIICQTGYIILKKYKIPKKIRAFILSYYKALFEILNNSCANQKCDKECALITRL